LSILDCLLRIQSLSFRAVVRHRWRCTTDRAIWLTFSWFLCLSVASTAADWSQFRGPNGSGLSVEKGLPTEFGPSQNVIWKTALPPGHSSPVLTDQRIFLTAFEGKQIYVICLDRAQGKILWRHEVPRNRVEELHKANSPASPSPVTDGTNVYAFFTDFGLISLGPEGQLRWKLPLGPFNNPFGLGSSPILAENKVLLVCDQESGSFFIAVDKDTGQVKWRVERPEYTRGFATPILYRPANGELQVLVSGSLQFTAYSVETGKELWWLRGITWQVKSTPVMSADTLFVHGWAGGADEGQQEAVEPFEEALKKMDTNHDGKLSKEEIKDEALTKDWDAMDLDRDGVVGERDWRFYRARRSAQNAVLAFRLGGTGDMTEKSFLWRYQKSLPNVPSPLLYKDVLYLMKEGGVLTALEASTGKVLKQARLQGALGDYFASPVAADDKIFTISHEGKVTVLKPGPEWEALATNDLTDECNATPAFADGKLYIRTRGALYCFGKQN